MRILIEQEAYVWILDDEDNLYFLSYGDNWKEEVKTLTPKQRFQWVKGDKGWEFKNDFDSIIAFIDHYPNEIPGHKYRVEFTGFLLGYWKLNLDSREKAEKITQSFLTNLITDILT